MFAKRREWPSRRSWGPSEAHSPGILVRTERRSVFPTSPDEVALIARLADRYSLPLMALGAETAPAPPAKEGRVLIRFDLMRGFSITGPDEPRAEAEPGTLWPSKSVTYGRGNDGKSGPL